MFDVILFDICLLGLFDKSLVEHKHLIYIHQYFEFKIKQSSGMDIMGKQVSKISEFISFDQAVKLNIFWGMVQTSIVIDAPVQVVRKVLFDFGSYPQWNPFIVKIQGIAKEQEQIHVDILLPGDSNPTHFDPFVLTASDHEFRWIGQLCCACFFSGEHYFILKQTQQNKTEFIHGEIFSGCLTPLFSCLTEKKTLEGFSLMNKALKERSEHN